MSAPDHLVREMAELAGLRLTYRSAFGEEVASPLETVRTLLARLGFPCDGAGETQDSLERLRARSRRPVPEIAVSRDGIPTSIAANVADGSDWRVLTEGGAAIAGRAERGQIDLPALDTGYHRLSVRIDGADVRSTIIAAPQRCWRPPVEGRRWGYSGSVYGFRRDGDLGIGDIGHVASLAEAAGRRGASFLGLSPLHALFPSDRDCISPYSPSSRLFVDPIYIDPRDLPGVGPAANHHGGGDLVDYDRVWSEKKQLLERAWQAHQGEAPSAPFDAYRAAGGETLALHAMFDALTEGDAEHRPAGGLAEPPQGKARSDIEASLRERISFYSWLQWIADRQLAQADAMARASGMDIGLLADLAVGASPNGSELWSQPGDYLPWVTIGAPPDLLAPQGQEWGLRAFNPIALEQSGMESFRRLVAASMRNCGGLRIDHAFQLRRLFLVPEGRTADQGAYLRYPLEALLAVLRVESHRAGCLVIGEDLGTKPPEFSEALEDAGVLGYRVVYFERGTDRRFTAPADYAPETMVVLNTHDLATFRGWWLGRDIADRVKYGVTDIEHAEAARTERQADRRRLVELLRQEGLLPAGDEPDDLPAELVARLLARCRSMLVGLSLDDVAGVTDQQNVPGVTDGPPNWRRRMPLSIADLAREGGPLDRFAQAMAAEGRGKPDQPTSQ